MATGTLDFPLADIDRQAATPASVTRDDALCKEPWEPWEPASALLVIKGIGVMTTVESTNTRELIEREQLIDVTTTDTFDNWHTTGDSDRLW